MYYIKQKKSKHVFLRGQIDIKPQLVDLNYLLRPNIEAGWGKRRNVSEWLLPLHALRFDEDKKL